MGLPGEDEVEIDVPATMGGTPDSCRLEETEDLCIMTDEDMESESTAFESRILWNRFNAAVVLLVCASAVADDAGVRRSFCDSNIFKNDEIFSPSSSPIDPELPPAGAASVIKPEPGWAEDVALPLPLLV
jgi:hypothetical protein